MASSAPRSDSGATRRAPAPPQAVAVEPPVETGDRSHETDIVTIGSGIGGVPPPPPPSRPPPPRALLHASRSLQPPLPVPDLPPSPHPAGLCAAALLARYGCRVTVLESHYLPGGAAHSFEAAGGYHFDAGPSFFAGLSGVLDLLSIIGEGEVQEILSQVGRGRARWPLRALQRQQQPPPAPYQLPAPLLADTHPHLGRTAWKVYQPIEASFGCSRGVCGMHHL